jgi:hypothetical protein
VALFERFGVDIVVRRPGAAGSTLSLLKRHDHGVRATALDGDPELVDRAGTSCRS